MNIEITPDGQIAKFKAIWVMANKEDSIKAAKAMRVAMSQIRRIEKRFKLERWIPE